MTEYLVEIKGKVRDWRPDDPFPVDLFQEQVKGLLNLHLEVYGFNSFHFGKGYSNVEVDIKDAGLSVEPNIEGNIGCLIYDVNISLVIDLTKYEIFMEHGLDWGILYPAFIIMPMMAAKHNFTIPEDYEELKERYPYINEEIIVHSLVNQLMEASLQDYDGNIMDFWDRLNIEVTPLEAFEGFEYFMNWFEDNPLEVKQ